LDQVLIKMGHLPQAVRPVLMQAFDMGLQKVRDHARTNHPAWPSKVFNPDGTWRYHNITTNLTNSIGLKVKEVPGAIEGDFGVLNETVTGGAMEYASKIERDHPFVAPAVEAKKDEWLNQINQALRSFFR